VAYDCRKKSSSQTTTLWTYIMKRANHIFLKMLAPIGKH
jgi:hypothetical protein